MFENNSIIGIDEVGRGSLAGPVMVGAVKLLLHEHASVEADLFALLKRSPRDSKKETLRVRRQIAEYVSQRFPHAVGMVDSPVIDSRGLSFALRIAADSALESLLPCDSIIADAGLFHSYDIETMREPKADEHHLTVLLASHVAKVRRDDLMVELGTTYPQYAWGTNVGYGTAEHRQAIRDHGHTPYHRQSFLKRLI